MPGADARRRISVQHCKPCVNPHDHGDILKYLPAELTQYVLNIFFMKSRPHHVTQTTFRLFFKDSKWGRSPATNRFAVEVGHGGGTGQISLDRPWSGKLTSSSLTTRYCATGPAVRIRTAKPTVCTAGCELVLHNGISRIIVEHFLMPGYGCVPHAELLSRYSAKLLHNRSHVWCKGDDGLW